MGFWRVIIDKLREGIKKMLGNKTIAGALKVEPSISDEMERAITLWSGMYKNKAPWLHEPDMGNPIRVVSLGIPALLASEKAKTAFIEWRSEITAPVEKVETEVPVGEGAETTQPIPSTQKSVEYRQIGNPARAEYLESQYKKLKNVVRKYAEYGIAMGGLVLKPYAVKNAVKVLNKDGKSTTDYPMSIDFDFIRADCFYPLSFENEMITEAAFLQTKVVSGSVYRRLEHHKWIRSENKTIITNRAFKSLDNNLQLNNDATDLGKEVPLSEVDDWKDMQPLVIINDVDRPLFAYFKMPEANTIELSSPLGVSVYSRVVSLIKDADMQYSRMLWEYEAGEMAIDIDRDALGYINDLTGTGKGQSILNSMQARLYRKVDLGSEGDTYQQFAPALRDNSYISGLNTILTRIEDAVGCSRGTISKADTEAMTATELKILRQRTYVSNADLQAAWQSALTDTVYIMNVYCDLYSITPDGDYDVSFEWDDSLIVDMDAELNKRILLVHNGISSKLETRMWYFGETENQAQEALAKIDEENVSDMQRNLIEQFQLRELTDEYGGQHNTEKDNSKKPVSAKNEKENEEEK